MVGLYILSHGYHRIGNPWGCLTKGYETLYWVRSPEYESYNWLCILEIKKITVSNGLKLLGANLF